MYMSPDIQGIIDYIEKNPKMSYSQYAKELKKPLHQVKYVIYKYFPELKQELAEFSFGYNTTKEQLQELVIKIKKFLQENKNTYTRRECAEKFGISYKKFCPLVRKYNIPDYFKPCTNKGTKKQYNKFFQKSEKTITLDDIYNELTISYPKTITELAHNLNCNLQSLINYLKNSNVYPEIRHRVLDNKYRVA